MVLDRDFVILIWSPKAEDLWGLRGDEARGRNLLSLDFGLPVERLKPAMRSCLSGEVTYQDITMEATNRRGKTIPCHITCTPMTGGDGVSGVILIMEEQSAPAPSGAGPSAGDGESRREPHAPSPASPAPDGHGSGDQVSPGQRP